MGRRVGGVEGGVVGARGVQWVVRAGDAAPLTRDATQPGSIYSASLLQDSSRRHSCGYVHLTVVACMGSEGSLWSVHRNIREQTHERPSTQG
ncbi:hypothetical protein E2C01_064071 [Portunus trituberculatus]|uniref:Uncharacterized protein n=1 Tax=Portunus trituberculatus TaxID=210409 RepID=A0A5B7HC44_PORTR|nr:hypothetical protein [Portunus trituberculatus]